MASKIVAKMEEDNAVRVSANMINTLKALVTQMTADAGIITAKQDLIDNAASWDDVTDNDLRELLDARVRTKANIERKAVYKAEFPALKAKITDTDMQAEIDAEIAKL